MKCLDCGATHGNVYLSHVVHEGVRQWREMCSTCLTYRPEAPWRTVPTHFVPKREAQHAAELAGYLARESLRVECELAGRNIAFALGLVACLHAMNDPWFVGKAGQEYAYEMHDKPWRVLRNAGLWQERHPSTPGDEG